MRDWGIKQQLADHLITTWGCLIKSSPNIEQFKPLSNWLVTILRKEILTWKLSHSIEIQSKIWWASRRSTSPSCRCGVHWVKIERERESIDYWTIDWIKRQFLDNSKRDSQNFEWNLKNEEQEQEEAEARAAEGCPERKKRLKKRRMNSCQEISIQNS